MLAPPASPIGGWRNGSRGWASGHRSSPESCRKEVRKLLERCSRQYFGVISAAGCQLRPKLAESGTTCAQTGSMLDQFGPNLVRMRPTLGEIGGLCRDITRTMLLGARAVSELPSCGPSGEESGEHFLPKPAARHGSRVQDLSSMFQMVGIKGGWCAPRRRRCTGPPPSQSHPPQ